MTVSLVRKVEAGDIDKVILGADYYPEEEYFDIEFGTFEAGGYRVEHRWLLKIPEYFVETCMDRQLREWMGKTLFINLEYQTPMEAWFSNIEMEEIAKEFANELLKAISDENPYFPYTPR